MLNSGDLKDDIVEMIGHMKNNSRLNVLSRFIMFTVFLPFPLASLKVLSPEDHLILLFILISGHRHWSFGGGGTWKDLREILSPSSLALALTVLISNFQISARGREMCLGHRLSILRDTISSASAFSLANTNVYMSEWN